MDRPKYQTVLLKLSGEALLGERGYGIDPRTVAYLAGEIKSVSERGVRVAVVIGGGNIFRGLEGGAEAGIDRTTSDYMGMLATVINSLALQNSLESMGIKTRVQSALPVASVAEPYIRRRAMRHLDKGRAVIFAAGTGNPYFTTDTAAALRALEINAEVLIKGTKVDGVFDKDPVLYPDAKKYTSIHYQDVLNQKLTVMDMTAITLCMVNELPITVYNLANQGDLSRIMDGADVGTTVLKCD